MSHPGLLHPRRAELGPSQLLPGAYQRRSGSRSSVELSGAILRGRAAAEADPGRSRARRTRDCSRRRCASAPATRSSIAAAAARRPPQADRAGAGAMPRKRSSGGWPRPPRRAKLLRELADTFELADVPKRIEVYDNSHIMGTNATGAMIVAGPEGFRKNSYRKFNIKSETHAGRRFRDDARSARTALRPAGEGRSRPRRAANGPTCC